MTEKGHELAKDEGALDEAELEELAEAPQLSALLKRALASSEDEDAGRDRRLLTSVQRKLRKRSKGKFYGDGWSTSGARVNYALVAVVMLLTVVAVYVALGPTGFSLR